MIVINIIITTNNLIITTVLLIFLLTCVSLPQLHSQERSQGRGPGYENVAVRVRLSVTRSEKSTQASKVKLKLHSAFYIQKS